jgi:RNA polymerase sigma-70 factor (ECF subfamily)
LIWSWLKTSDARKSAVRYSSGATADFAAPDVLAVVVENKLSIDSPANDCGATHAAESDGSQAQLVATLFREHNDSLVRFLTSRLRSPQEAREVAQEAYVRVLSLDTPGAVSFLRAFLFKTAANIAIDRIRHRHRCPHANDVSLFDELHDCRTPEVRAEGAQEIALLTRLLAQLPTKCRYAFLLHKVDGLPTREIGAHMNLSERQVRDYILRALLHCRAGLVRAGVITED